MESFPHRDSHGDSRRHPRRRMYGNDILAAMLTVFAVMRISLTLNPTANFDIAGFNVHHLFTGVLLLVGAACR